MLCRRRKAPSGTNRRELDRGRPMFHAVAVNSRTAERVHRTIFLAPIVVLLACSVGGEAGLSP